MWSPTLLEAGVEVVVLTDDQTWTASRTALPGRALHFEGMRLGGSRLCPELRPRHAVAAGVPAPSWWLLADQHRRNGQPYLGGLEGELLEIQAGVWMPAAFGILVLRISRPGPKALVRVQMQYTPKPGIYDDLFERFKPDLVIAATPGWRLDRYLLREATLRGIPTAASIVGWDNPSSYAIPGAVVDWATCWSEAQRRGARPWL